MTQAPSTRPQPSPQVMAAMMRFRQDDNEGALQLAEAALENSSEKAPLMAIASLAALRLGRPEVAIPHLVALLAINPADHATRANLANAYIATGDQDAALDLVVGQEGPGMARIEGFLRQERGDLADASEAYRRALASDANDLSSWNNLGNLLARTGDTDGAIAAFERAIALAPGELSIYLNLAEVLREADLSQPRLKVLYDAERVAPDNQRVLVEIAITHARLDDLDTAIATLQRAIAKAAHFGDAHIELGLIYENLNRIEDLDRLIDSIDRDTAPPEFAYLLAWQARRDGRFEDAAALARAIPETVDPQRRFNLIGGIEERLGNSADAFAAFEAMNRAALASAPVRSGLSYRETVERDLAAWSEEWAASWSDLAVADDYRDPVFLVGFPRSGTTLLDTMLMGLPALSVLEERPMLAQIAKAVGQRDLAALTSEDVARLRAAYFAKAREQGWDDTRWLVDKHPLSMARVPLIHRLFPKAKIILAERHPYDVVLSCFMANFQLNFAMRSFADLDEAARTYDTVWRAWERGRALFPVDVREVRYERLVEDVAGELAPIVDWLGLEWDERVADHTATARERGRVRTASYAQIGENLYTRASYRWRRYADSLHSVIPILEPWALKLGYVA